MSIRPHRDPPLTAGQLEAELEQHLERLAHFADWQTGAGAQEYRLFRKKEQAWIAARVNEQNLFETIPQEEAP